MSAIEIRETDLGSKKRTRKAIKRVMEKRKEMERELQPIISKIVQDAKRMCPIDTGMLQRSIRAVQVYDSPKGTYFTRELYLGWNWTVIAGGPPYFNPKYKKIVDYAQAVHDGTYKMPPRPFLTDALEINRAELTDALNRYAEKLEREWARD